MSRKSGRREVDGRAILTGLLYPTPSEPELWLEDTN